MYSWQTRTAKPKACPKCKQYMKAEKLPNPIIYDLRKLKDSAFDEARKLSGKKQDEEFENLAVLLAIAELSGGKHCEIGFTEEEIKPRFEELYMQVILEFIVRKGELEAKYDKNGRIVSMKLTEKGTKNAEEILSKLNPLPLPERKKRVSSNHE